VRWRSEIPRPCCMRGLRFVLQLGCMGVAMGSVVGLGAWATLSWRAGNAACIRVDGDG
jgi:hypothetical protein